MADCKKCDRCGEYYDLFDKNGYSLPASLRGAKLSLASATFDLCPTCFDQFFKFMGIDDDDDA